MRKTLLERSIRLINPNLIQGEAIEIDYIRQGSDLSPLQIKLGNRECHLHVRPGRSAIESFDIEGNTVTAKTQDFIVAMADLMAGGGQGQLENFEPSRGDLIKWKREYNGADATLTYEVLPIDGARCLDPLDSFGVLFRIHTKLNDIRS